MATKKKSANTLAGRLQAAQEAGFITLDEDQALLVKRAFVTEDGYRDYRYFHFEVVIPGETDWTRRQRQSLIEQAMDGVRPSEWVGVENDLPTVDESRARLEILDAARRRSADNLEFSIDYASMKAMLDEAYQKEVLDAENLDPDKTTLREFIAAKERAQTAKAALLELAITFGGIELGDKTVRTTIKRAFEADPSHLPDVRTVLGRSQPVLKLEESDDDAAESDVETFDEGKTSYLDRKRRPEEAPNRSYMTEGQIAAVVARELAEKEAAEKATPKSKKQRTKSGTDKTVLAGSTA